MTESYFSDIEILQRKIKTARANRTMILNGTFRNEIWDNKKWTKEHKLNILKDSLNEEYKLIEELLDLQSDK